MSGYTQAYVRDSVLSMSPEQILLKLYDCALLRLQQASDCLSGGNRPGASVAISKALAIVYALREALDRDCGSTLVPKLDQLYGVMSHWLIDANSRQVAEPIQNCREVMSTLKKGWDGAVAQLS